MIKKLASNPMKIVYLVLGLGLLLLGVIGLIFPLIPGVLFLVAAVFVLGKASSRIKAWSASSPTYTGVERRVALLGGARPWDRVKLGCLMAADAVVRSDDSGISMVRRTLQRAR